MFKNKFNGKCRQSQTTNINTSTSQCVKNSLNFGSSSAQFAYQNDFAENVFLDPLFVHTPLADEDATEINSSKNAEIINETFE